MVNLLTIKNNPTRICTTKYSSPTAPIAAYLESLELIHLTSVRAGIIRDNLVSFMNLFIMEARQNANISNILFIPF